MSNSNLICYTKTSPNSNPRRHDVYNPSGKITKITIHHMAGNLSVETCGNVFQNRQASANYGVGSDGRIALYVPEDRRAWTSSSPDNDYKAVTIEVANDGGAPDWHVSDKALEATVALCVDICQRNGIDRLNYTGDKNGNLTMHKWFAATACPGPYLGGKFPYIAEEVNRRLEAAKQPQEPVPAKPQKSLDEVARAVIRGDYGNGAERAQRLKAEGYDPEAVQARVNELLTPAKPQKSLDEVARAVIRGDYGNGAERKKRLQAEGWDPEAVQDRVNELM